MKLQRKAASIFDRALGVPAALSGALIISIMLLVALGVIMRHFFHRPIVWVNEITEICLVFILYLSTAWVLKKEGHVVMDLLVNKLGAKSRDLTNVITSILAAIICLIITAYGIRVGWDYFQIDFTYAGSFLIPAFLLEAVVPLGTFLLFIQFLRRAYGYLGKLRAL